MEDDRPFALELSASELHPRRVIIHRVERALDVHDRERALDVSSRSARHERADVTRLDSHRRDARLNPSARVAALVELPSASDEVGLLEALDPFLARVAAPEEPRDITGRLGARDVVDALLPVALMSSEPRRSLDRRPLLRLRLARRDGVSAPNGLGIRLAALPGFVELDAQTRRVADRLGRSELVLSEERH
jgi:hypothetical protein